MVRPVKPLPKKRDNRHRQMVADVTASFWWKWNTLPPATNEQVKVRIAMEHALADFPKPVETPTQRELKIFNKY